MSPSKREGHAYFQSLSRLDRQDPSLSTMAPNQTRPRRHGCFHSTARHSVPNHLHYMKLTTAA